MLLLLEITGVYFSLLARLAVAPVCMILKMWGRRE